MSLKEARMSSLAEKLEAQAEERAKKKEEAERAKKSEKVEGRKITSKK